MVIKSLYKAICMFYFVCILALYMPARAQWTEPMQLTDSISLMNPRAVAVGQHCIVHILCVHK